ncbi:bidirectional sugar transporter SWEET6b [Striga asiatica]|uniref:Bidirectional sugar transporter SWEET n=1 Tax=Striga asiatica TaxID=4170 RepID=A0A5A7P9W9_STRAF|nr:bidirectional sugar transporter SWEET6b [Striga asiatica]
MVSQSIIRNVVGIIAAEWEIDLSLISLMNHHDMPFLRNGYGLPTYKRICKKKTTEEFHPWPYLATTMNCIFWIFYGIPIVHPDSTLVVTINGVGLGLEIIYLTIFFYYTNSKNRRTILLVLFAEIVLLAIIAVITLVCFHTHNARSMFVGIVCIIFGTLMYFSPLSIMWTVWKTKSAEFLPFWLCFAGFCNGVCWFSYAFLKKFDPYLAITNGLGGLFGLFQIIVYAYYTLRAKSNKGSSVGDGAKTSDEQLKKNYMASPA